MSKREKNSSNKTVFISGKFEVLHPGHLRLFRFARELGDHLIVGVLSDKLAKEQTSQLIIPEDLRVEGVQSHSEIDEVVFVKDSVSKTIKDLKPDYVVKGKEHESLSNEEQDVVEEYGGRLVFSSGEVVFSSLDLLKNLSGVKPKIANLPSDYLDRHEIEKNTLISTLEKFSNLNICIIGDLIIDEYISCDPLGMSQEEPSIVVKPIGSEKFIGGAGIVSAHAASLGAKVNYFGVSGNDETRDFALEKLKEYGVNSTLILDESRPTTRKLRYRAQEKTLFRVSYLHQDSIGQNLQKNMVKELENVISESDLVVFSDFNYGCLPQTLVNKILKKVNRDNLIMTADSQASSQTGDISRFKGMDLIMPTEREARVALRNQEDGLVVLLEKLRKKSDTNNIILKLGVDGALLSVKEKNLSPQIDRIPALNSSPRDIMGAGDSMLIGASLALALKDTSPWLAGCIGSILAAHQVSQIGNIPLNLDRILQELKD